MELQNMVYWSKSGRFAIEVKMRIEAKNAYATVTYRKAGPTLEPIDYALNDSEARITAFLENN